MSTSYGDPLEKNWLFNVLIVNETQKCGCGMMRPFLSLWYMLVQAGTVGRDRDRDRRWDWDCICI